MRTLYNIHTHRITYPVVDGFRVCSVINLYPSEYKYSPILGKNDYFISCGIHPWHSSEVSEDDLCVLSNVVHNKQVIAVGEIGLDLLSGVDIQTQEAFFIKQIELAQEVRKPLLIHCVKAWDRLIELYKKYKSGESWIVHGFRGNHQQAKQLCDLGFKLSIGKYYNQESLKYIPVKSLFLETDDADISILDIYKYVSEMKNINLDELIDWIAENVYSVFLHNEF